jgi:hypothetical protein
LVNNGNPGKWSHATLISSNDRRASSAGRIPAPAERKFIRSKEKEIKMYANRFFTLLVAVALVSITALTIQEAVATKAVALAPQLHEAQRQRIRAAEVARWTAMGEYYENLEASKLVRGRAADTARWKAMGEYYQNLAGDQVLSRAQSADAARWTAMAEYYAQWIGTTR